jgi:hypothetical protein
VLMCGHKTFVKPNEEHVKYVSYIVRQVYKAREFLTPFFCLTFCVSVYLNEVSVCDQGVCYPEEIQKFVLNITDGV